MDRQALAGLAARWIHRAERLALKIEGAFVGEPFSREWPADHPKNVKRFNLYVKLLMRAFNFQVKASNFWIQVHDIDPLKPGQVDAAAVPPEYEIVGYAPGQTLLQRKKVTPENPVAPHTATKSPGLRPRSNTEFAHSAREPNPQNPAAKRKPH